ncbi:acyloxyacyl hydrolase [Staphylococcus carnosus]|nr:acyloxyacyl hydrolase [Staphylococcus carnosus]
MFLLINKASPKSNFSNSTLGMQYNFAERFILIYYFSCNADFNSSLELFHISIS